MSAEAATETTGGGLTFDPELLDRMTGAKGNTSDIETKCQALLAALGPVLSAAFEKATGVEFEARPGAVRQGRRRDLLAELSADTVFCETTISGWSKEISSLCGTRLIIGLVECLLGGSDPADLDVAARPLSGIELDMSLVVFEQLNDCLSGLVSTETKPKTTVSRPQADIPEEEDDKIANFHGAALTLDIEFGSISAPLTLILPQAILLKTRIAAPKTSPKTGETSGEWAERLNERVSRSEIALQASVALKPLPLGEISRLMPGDLIAFKQSGDIEVTLSANGTPLYTCALGRAGSRYMIKIEGQAGPDENWKSDFA